MTFISVLFLMPALAFNACASPTPFVERDASQFSLRLITPNKLSTSSNLTNSSTIARLVPSNVQGHSSQALERYMRSKNATPYLGLYPNNHGASYSIDVDFGGETFSMIFDTGSSDMWLPQSNVECVDYNGRRQPLEQCGFGKLHQGGFQYGKLNDTYLKISYGDGEFLSGTFGLEDVSIAGITVSRQEAALVDYAYWAGDGVTSGLAGFAYPALTSAFTQADLSNQVPNLQYPNWITNAISRNLLEHPSFSVAMERGKNGAEGGGYVALGGLPPVDFEQNWTATDIRVLQLQSGQKQQFTYYTIQPDGFIVRANNDEHFFNFNELMDEEGEDEPSITGRTGNWTQSHASGSVRRKATPDEKDAAGQSAPQNSTSSGPTNHSNDGGSGSDPDFVQTDDFVIVDTGTTLNYLPSKVVRKIASAFNPPAFYFPELGSYEAFCNAEPPEVAVVISGVEFKMSPLDVLLQNEIGYDPETGLCSIGFQESGSPWILGTVFLKNVVAVFDIGNAQMRFAPHVDY